LPFPESRLFDTSGVSSSLKAYIAHRDRPKGTGCRHLGEMLHVPFWYYARPAIKWHVWFSTVGMTLIFQKEISQKRFVDCF